MTLTRLAVLAALVMQAPTAASAQRAAAPKDAYLYIIWPSDGDTVKGAFWCRFGLRNMGVTHAGDDFADSGHHHLLIDADEPIDPGEPIPQDKKHFHYGAGETEALVELPPGKHTLQLVFSDGKHLNFDPPLVSKKITITVRNTDAAEKSAHTAGNDDRARSKRRRVARDEAKKPAADAAPATPKSSGPVEFISRVFGVSQ